MHIHTRANTHTGTKGLAQSSVDGYYPWLGTVVHDLCGLQSKVLLAVGKASSLWHVAVMNTSLFSTVFVLAYILPSLINHPQTLFWELNSPVMTFYSHNPKDWFRVGTGFELIQSRVLP